MVLEDAYQRWVHDLGAGSFLNGRSRNGCTAGTRGDCLWTPWFAGEAGLYYIGGIGDRVGDTMDRVAMEGILRAENMSEPSSVSVIGGAFLFMGHRFLLWLDPKAAPFSLRGVGISEDDWRRAASLRHVTALKLKHGRYLSQRVTFRW